jgi:hypothetical protein
MTFDLASNSSASRDKILSCLVAKGLPTGPTRHIVPHSVLYVRLSATPQEDTQHTPELAQKLDKLEQKYERHGAHIQEIFEAIRQLIEQPTPPWRQIGFKPGTQEPPAK